MHMSYSFTVLYKDIPVAHVDVSDNHKETIIEKLIPDGIMQPFNGDRLDLERVYVFLKSRCYEDSYVGLADILEVQNMTSNNPWEWNRKTHGVTWEDFFWIRFDGEDLLWEDIRWKR